jgi:2-hydroxychromene-2-carboxylate isomerase
MPRVEHHFDFGSPNAYLAHLVIPEIEARTGVRFESVPILLGGVFKLTNNQSPAQSLAGIRNKPEYERLETQRFVQRHAITRYRFNPHFPINTLTLMRGATGMQMRRPEDFDRYVAVVYRAMWEVPVNLGDPEVLAATLSAAGFDVAAFLAMVGDPEVKARLVATTEEAVARGVFGAPTFFVGEAMFFGQDRLDFVRDALAR